MHGLMKNGGNPPAFTEHRPWHSKSTPVAARSNDADQTRWEAHVRHQSNGVFG